MGSEMCIRDSTMLMKALQKRDEQAIRMTGLWAVIAALLGAVTLTAFLIIAGDSFTDSDTGAIPWAVAAFIGLFVLIACALFARLKPARALPCGTLALIGGVVAALCMRAVMWLIGTPFMDFFLMSLE